MKTSTLRNIAAVTLLALSTSVFAVVLKPGTVTAVNWSEGACYATVSGTKANVQIQGVTKSECGILQDTLVGMSVDSITVK